MRRTFAAVLLSLAACGEATLDEVAPEVFELQPTYEAHIRPLLARHCATCHSGHGLRDGGVELDRYESAYSNRVRNTCVSVNAEVTERFAEYLLPVPRDGVARPHCDDWEPLTMPPGARTRLTLEEQIILARWVELGAPR